jgi:hypothetical protein
VGILRVVKNVSNVRDIVSKITDRIGNNFVIQFPNIEVIEDMVSKNVLD